MAYIGEFLYFLTFLQIERGVIKLIYIYIYIYISLFNIMNMCYLWAAISHSV
jgi:hypothetical protein